MSKKKNLFAFITTLDGLYGIITNTWVATVLLPALAAGGALLMAWARGLPWLEIYVVGLFVAASAAVLIRQILDRWQSTTDRENLTYLSMDYVIKLDEETGNLDHAVATIKFKNSAYKRMTVQLDKFDLKVSNRVPANIPRRVSKFTTGSGVEGYFSSNSVDLRGIDEDAVDANITCIVSYGFGPKMPHKLISELAGKIEKVAPGKYKAQFWDAEVVDA